MGDYCIKDGYEHRTTNATLEHDAGDYWSARRILYSRYSQVAVYREAVALVHRHGLKAILDVGCGTAIKLMQMLAPLTKVTGTDQPGAVDIARQHHPLGRFVAQDFESSDAAPPGRFDLVLCADVIEHMLDPDVLLKYILAACNPQAYVVLSTPQRDVLRGPSNSRSPKQEHVREWNQAELADYLTSRGLTVVRHDLVAAFSVGRSWTMWRERWRYLKKGLRVRHTQMVVCRPGDATEAQRPTQ
jgi:SAM-dependent methyltransferase